MLHWRAKVTEDVEEVFLNLIGEWCWMSGSSTKKTSITARRQKTSSWKRSLKGWQQLRLIAAGCNTDSLSSVIAVEGDGVGPHLHRLPEKHEHDCCRGRWCRATPASSTGETRGWLLCLIESRTAHSMTIANHQQQVLQRPPLVLPIITANVCILHNKPMLYNPATFSYVVKVKYVSLDAVSWVACLGWLSAMYMYVYCHVSPRSYHHINLPLMFFLYFLHYVCQ